MLLKLTIISVTVGIVISATQQAVDEQVLRVPSMPEWKLVHRVDPQYPPAALRHRIQGTVRLSAVVGKDGHTEIVRLISGHPLLVSAARNAARQWVYTPTLLGGKPIQVITFVDIQFQLDSYGKPLTNQDPKPEATLQIF